ncbi:MAG: D-tyrosyl-tRNA(Tyr) deacylase [Candidatus Dadabacteria bacterium]|nr:D-tyrosyl-tRNA(Tyr) deacylase [Candidatus Dadabacteria bacterium]NIQ12893.1 D-tyrosyl-tRNA(Tyr) deacylase [Candidatus Dadabacteria bacterium]
MRAVIQRVSRASVKVDGRVVGQINKGLLVFLGIKRDDGEKDINYLADKIVNLRIFEDENQKMNLSLLNIGGEILLISQFTLYGDCTKGRRPSYDKAASPEFAEKMYEKFIEKLKSTVSKTETGIFGADMRVDLVNSGPVTLLLDSSKEF